MRLLKQWEKFWKKPSQTDMTSPLAHLNIIADDAAQSAAIDDGIRDLAAIGILTGVAAFANFGRLQYMRYLASWGVQAGIHLNISSGRPVSHPTAVASLVNADGTFKSPHATDSSPRAISDALLHYKMQHLPRIEEAQVVTEFQAQINLFEKVLGYAPAFAAVHHDLDMEERLQKILAHAFPALPGRQHRLQSSVLAGYFYAFLNKEDTFETATRTVSELILQAIYKSTAAAGRPSEVVCHPGYASPEASAFTVYNQQRQMELKAWRSEVVLSLLRNGIRSEDNWTFDSDTIVREG